LVELGYDVEYFKEEDAAKSSELNLEEEKMKSEDIKEDVDSESNGGGDSPDDEGSEIVAHEDNSDESDDYAHVCPFLDCKSVFKSRAES
jgi:hypothetical protein